MNAKAIIRNINNKGLKEVYKVYVRRRHARKLINEISNRPFNKISEPERYRSYMDMVFGFEKELKKTEPKLYRKYLSDIKKIYVKDIIPKLYADSSIKPIEKKVVFMENGNSPSPSNYYISQAMARQGEYDVHLTGLKVRQVSYLEYYENALEFVADMSTAKAVFLSTANDLLSQFDVRPETKVIQLWHGVGVFKKIGYSTVNKNFGKSRDDREEYNQYRNYSHVTIASEEQAWIFEEAMNISKDSGIIIPVGVSRTDVFYDSMYIDNSYEKLYGVLPKIRGKKILLYAPTFRGTVANAQAPNRLDIDILGASLADEYVLLIKHHGLSKNIPEIPSKWKDSFAFDVGENKLLGIERLLTIADICITDYSSIAFEYAIMERPLIFFAYDLDDYIDKRGIYYNYEDITPGPVCKTTEEMLDYIKNIDERFDKQEVIDFKNKHVGACDGHATERTIELIERQKEK